MSRDAAPQDEAIASSPAPESGPAGGPRFIARLADFDIRVASGITVVVAILVFWLSNTPLAGGFELDLREGDRVGGWSQLTLVGFSVSKPNGRTIPDRPGREGARFVSNRPFPAEFALELEASWLEAEAPGALEVAIGASTVSMEFGSEPELRVVRLQNPEGRRIITLKLSSDDELVVRRVAIRPGGAAS